MTDGGCDCCRALEAEIADHERTLEELDAVRGENARLIVRIRSLSDELLAMRLRASTLAAELSRWSRSFGGGRR